MLVSVIILNKDKKEQLQQSIPVLLSQNIKGGYEIIVVDDKSTDGSREYLEKLPIKLIKINPEIYNFAKAFNGGLKTSKGKYVIKLSGDVIVTSKNFLQKMISPFTDLKVGATYGRYIITNKNPGYSYPYFWPAERFPAKLTRYSIKPNPFKMIFDEKHGIEVTNLAGGCCAIRGDILKKRPLNEKLMAGEDSEYAWFLHTVGFDIVFNPEVEVIHEHRITSAISNWISKDMIILSFSYVKYYFGKLLGKDPYGELFKDFCFQTE